MQEDGFKKREEALKLKDLELQESLIRFSKFLQEMIPSGHVLRRRQLRRSRLGLPEKRK